MRIVHLLVFVLLCACAAACSDTISQSTADAKAQSSADGGQTGQLGDGASADPGYVPLETSLTGHWMQRTIGNCKDQEEWMSFLLPADFRHTLVDRNTCDAPSVVWTVGNMALLGGQVLETEWQDKYGWQIYRRTSAIVDNFPHTLSGLAVPGYVTGPRGLTVLAFVRTTPNGTFMRKDHREFAADKAEPTHTTTDVGVQVGLVPAPDSAKAGDACSMALTLAAAYDTGELGKYTYTQEELTLPCHYAKDEVTGWLKVTADGYEASATDGSWDKLFQSKGWYKKYPANLAQLLYNSFRPVLLQPPSQRNVLLSDAEIGWYQEYLNEPPKKL